MAVLLGGVKKNKAPKYTYGNMLYSYLNPTKAGRVFKVIKSNDPSIDHMYQLTLKDKDGLTYSSKVINEKSLYKTKRK